MDPLRRTCCAALLGAALPLPSRAASGSLHVGLTAVMLVDQAAFLARWSRYLAQRTGLEVRFVVRDEYQPIMDMLLQGPLDAAWICGYPYVRHADELRLLAVPVYQGAPLYRSYLIRALGAENIGGWRDLRGRVLAMSDPLSNSGWLVARHALRSAGVAPDALRRSFFAHGHRHVAEAVAAGLADAGAIDGYVWDTMRQLDVAAARETEVVWRSPLYGFPPLVARTGSLAPGVRALRAQLLHMRDDAEGRALIHALNLDGFAEVQPTLYASIRTLATEVPETGILPPLPATGTEAQ